MSYTEFPFQLTTNDTVVWSDPDGDKQLITIKSITFEGKETALVTTQRGSEIQCPVHELMNLNQEFTKTDVKVRQLKSLIEEHRLTNVEFEDWHEPMIESIVEDLEELGFFQVEVAYSGFWSQGDGASFTGKFRYDSREKIVVSDYNLFKDDLPSLMSVLSNISTLDAYVEEHSDEDHVFFDGCIDRYKHGHYVHEKTTGLISPMCHNMVMNQFNSDREVDDWVEQFNSVLVSLNLKIYQLLEAEYNDLTSDEAVFNTLQINDFYGWEVKEGVAADIMPRLWTERRY